MVATFVRKPVNGRHPRFMTDRPFLAKNGPTIVGCERLRRAHFRKLEFTLIRALLALN
jgi:hypothetical protein